MALDAKRVLIVDDDADFVDVIATFLEANRYAVMKAHSGAEGVRLARLERPDLILMDIMMSERTEGFFAIQEIRRAPEMGSVPIFVISAVCGRLPDFEIPRGGGWLAHDMFFPKPVDTGQLLEKIRHCIGPLA